MSLFNQTSANIAAQKQASLFEGSAEGDFDLVSQDAAGDDVLTAAVGSKCPDCSSRNTEDNGGTEYRCVECDHRWGIDCGERYGY